MFSDTHCHLSHIVQRGENLKELLFALQDKETPFVLDIGTKPGDLLSRVSLIHETTEENIPHFLHFTCGIWPESQAIANAKDSLKALENDLQSLLNRDSSINKLLHKENTEYLALGECGLDRHWNGPGAAQRPKDSSEDGPGTVDIKGEEALFEAQLEMAKKYTLPIVIHSREAFEPTYGCIKNSGHDDGVIHCFSYEKKEAKAFLDRGWYISFLGTITWAKKNTDRDRIAALLRYVPKDRFLLETDAPYLTPTPHRGKTNTPLLIEHTYKAAAEYLGMDVESLSMLVVANARELFKARQG